MKDPFGNAIFVGIGIFIIGILVWMLSMQFCEDSSFVILYAASTVCGTLYYLSEKNN